LLFWSSATVTSAVVDDDVDDDVVADSAAEVGRHPLMSSSHYINM